jgi:hypothetical protein
MALANSSRNGARIIWVALHTAEGSRRRGDLYNFFDTVRSGSSHGGADGTGLDDGWVPDDRAAWTLLNGNPVSLNLEMCAFARWTREQWLSTGTVDGVVNPRQMIRNAAEWARRKCEKYGIPKTHIGVDGVAARRPGIIMHRDYTLGARDGDHTDIGNNFPWDVFFADMNGTSEEDDMAGEGPEILALLRNLDNWLLKGGPGPDAVYAGKPTAGLGRSSAVAVLHDNNKALRAVYELTGKPIGAVLVELLNRDPADLDEAAVATALLPALTAAVDRLGDVELDRVAQAVADEQDRRARDNDPTTGPNS